MINTIPKQAGFTIRLDEASAADAIKHVENGPRPVIIGVEFHSPSMLFANAEQINAAFGAGSEVATMAIRALDTRTRETTDEYHARLNQEEFDKATKINANDYTGWVSWPVHGDNDGYFRSVDALLEHCANHEIKAPAFVWACTAEHLHINAAAILEDALEEHFEDAGDSITATELERLQTFLDEWTAAQRITSWHEDRTRAVMLPPVDGSEVER